MQHLRNLTRKHANKRREQREVLIEAHRARAASVAMGKARRKWGYSRNMMNRIDTLTKGSKSATAAASKAKAKATSKGTRTGKRSPDIESVSDSDELVSNDDRQKMSRAAAQKKVDDFDQEWDDTDEAETAIAKPLTIKLRSQAGARALNDRRGTFWNNYKRNKENEDNDVIGEDEEDEEDYD